MNSDTNEQKVAKVDKSDTWYIVPYLYSSLIGGGGDTDECRWYDDNDASDVTGGGVGGGDGGG